MEVESFSSQNSKPLACSQSGECQKMRCSLEEEVANTEECSKRAENLACAGASDKDAASPSKSDSLEANLNVEIEVEGEEQHLAGAGHVNQEANGEKQDPSPPRGECDGHLRSSHSQPEENICFSQKEASADRVSKGNEDEVDEAAGVIEQEGLEKNGQTKDELATCVKPESHYFSTQQENPREEDLEKSQLEKLRTERERICEAERKETDENEVDENEEIIDQMLEEFSKAKCKQDAVETSNNFQQREGEAFAEISKPAPSQEQGNYYRSEESESPAKDESNDKERSDVKIQDENEEPNPVLERYEPEEFQADKKQSQSNNMIEEHEGKAETKSKNGGAQNSQANWEEEEGQELISAGLDGVIESQHVEQARSEKVGNFKTHEMKVETHESEILNNTVLENAEDHSEKVADFEARGVKTVTRESEILNNTALENAEKQPKKVADSDFETHEQKEERPAPEILNKAALENAEKLDESEKVADFETHETKAETNEMKVETHETKAETHETKAETHERKAETHEMKAETHETKAETHEMKAETHKTKAETHETKAETHETKAETRETKAETLEAKVETHETKAETHEMKAETRGAEILHNATLEKVEKPADLGTILQEHSGKTPEPFTSEEQVILCVHNDKSQEKQNDIADYCASHIISDSLAEKGCQNQQKFSQLDQPCDGSLENPEPQRNSVLTETKNGTESPGKILGSHASSGGNISGIISETTKPRDPPLNFIDTGAKSEGECLTNSEKRGCDAMEIEMDDRPQERMVAENAESNEEHRLVQQPPNMENAEKQEENKEDAAKPLCDNFSTTASHKSGCEASPTKLLLKEPTLDPELQQKILGFIDMSARPIGLAELKAICAQNGVVIAEEHLKDHIRALAVQKDCNLISFALEEEKLLRLDYVIHENKRVKEQALSAEELAKKEEEELTAKLRRLNEHVQKLREKKYKVEATVKSNPRIKKLHAYNELKDACQSVLGKLADFDKKTIIEVHEDFGLTMDD